MRNGELEREDFITMNINIVEIIAQRKKNQFRDFHDICLNTFQKKMYFEIS